MGSCRHRADYPRQRVATGGSLPNQNRKPRLWREENLQSIWQDKDCASQSHDDCGSRGDLERRAKKVKSPFVFPSKGNLERPIGSVRKAHDAAVEKAGIKEHFRLYDLRHTYATRAVAAAVDLATLSDILGHTSIQMTMRYVHPGEEQRKLAAGKFETFRVAGIVEAMERSRQPLQFPLQYNERHEHERL